MKMNQKLKLGIWSSVSIVVVVAVAIVLNILVGALNISFDMTPKKIYTVSEQTKSIVQGLEQDVTIYIISSEDAFSLDYKQIVQQYERYSNHIQVVYRDLTLYPGFASQYAGDKEINIDSMVVVCGDKYVYLDSAEFVDIIVSEDYYSYDVEYQLEGLLTAAINQVNDGETSIIYQTMGHNEYTLSDSVVARLLRDNYSVANLSLTNQDAVPEDADVVLINSPTDDFSKADCDKLRDYMAQGGNVYVILEAEVVLENLEGLTEDYGIQVADGIVMEQNASMIYGAGSEQATPTYILPIIEDTEITHEFCENHLAMIVPVAKGLTTKNTSGYTVTGLLSTSDYAYSKVNLSSSYISREDGDIVGPFYLAALSEKEDAGTMIVLSCSNVLATDVDELVVGNNSDFFANGLNYMLGDTDKIATRSNAVTVDMNVYGASQAYIISGITVIGIPLIILGIGIVIGILRKRRSQNWNRPSEEAEDTEASETSDTSEVEDLETKTEETEVSVSDD